MPWEERLTVVTEMQPYTNWEGPQNVPPEMLKWSSISIRYDFGIGDEVKDLSKLLDIVYYTCILL